MPPDTFETPSAIITPPRAWRGIGGAGRGAIRGSPYRVKTWGNRTFGGFLGNIIFKTVSISN